MAKPMTHSEIAAEMGVSKQRVHQIEQAALAKLRAMLLRRRFDPPDIPAPPPAEYPLRIPEDWTPG